MLGHVIVTLNSCLPRELVKAGKCGMGWLQVQYVLLVIPILYFSSFYGWSYLLIKEDPTISNLLSIINLTSMDVLIFQFLAMLAPISVRQQMAPKFR